VTFALRRTGSRPRRTALPCRPRRALAPLGARATPLVLLSSGLSKLLYLVCISVPLPDFGIRGVRLFHSRSLSPTPPFPPPTNTHSSTHTQPSSSARIFNFPNALSTPHTYIQRRLGRSGPEIYITRCPRINQFFSAMMSYPRPIASTTDEPTYSEPELSVSEKPSSSDAMPI